jgi:hypothetical protein
VNHPYQIILTAGSMVVEIEKSEIQYVDEKPESLYASEPHQIVHIDNVQVLGLDPADADFYINFSDERRKRVIHKVQPTGVFCYRFHLCRLRDSADVR